MSASIETYSTSSLVVENEDVNSQPDCSYSVPFLVSATCLILLMQRHKKQACQ